MSITKNGNGKIGIDGDQMTDKKDPIVVTIKKEQTLEQAIRLTKVEQSNPSELIERIEEEKAKSDNHSAE